MQFCCRYTSSILRALLLSQWWAIGTWEKNIQHHGIMKMGGVGLRVGPFNKTKSQPTFGTIFQRNFFFLWFCSIFILLLKSALLHVWYRSWPCLVCNMEEQSGQTLFLNTNATEKLWHRKKSFCSSLVSEKNTIYCNQGQMFNYDFDLRSYHLC